MKIQQLLKLLLLIQVLLVSHAVFSQEVPQDGAGIIIMRNGDVVFGIPTEISTEYVKYYRTDKPEKTIYTVKKNTVYAIVHSDKSTEIITPLPGQNKNTDMMDSISLRQARKDTFMYNLTHGLVRAGVGFVQNHGSIDRSGFSKSGSTGFLVGYVFPLNRSLKVGAQVAFNNFKYKRSAYSDYDEMQIDQRIKDKIFSPGVFARYDLNNLFIRPYLLAGLALNFYRLKTESVITAGDGRGIQGTGDLHGSKFDLLLRGGADLHLSSKFGAYGDIGLGLNLIQLGVFFNLK